MPVLIKEVVVKATINLIDNSKPSVSLDTGANAKAVNQIRTAVDEVMKKERDKNER